MPRCQININRFVKENEKTTDLIRYEHPILDGDMTKECQDFCWVDAPIHCITLCWQIQHWSRFCDWRPGICIYYPMFAVKAMPWARWLLCIYPRGIRPAPPPKSEPQVSVYLRLHCLDQRYRDRRVRANIYIKVHERNRCKLMTLKHIFEEGDTFGVANLIRADDCVAVKNSLRFIFGFRFKPLRRKSCSVSKAS